MGFNCQAAGDERADAQTGLRDRSERFAPQRVENSIVELSSAANFMFQQIFIGSASGVSMLKPISLELIGNRPYTEDPDVMKIERRNPFPRDEGPLAVVGSPDIVV